MPNDLELHAGMLGGKMDASFASAPKKVDLNLLHEKAIPRAMVERKEKDELLS